MTDTSKMRSEFLEWHKGQVNMLVAAGELDAANEARRLEPIYWCAWQASRQAVVVELPREHFEFEGDKAPEMYSAEVINAIEAAGLRCEVAP